jgi:hypothetical protein
MLRQLGAVLGVALLIAVVGKPKPAKALAAFHHGWLLAAIASAAAIAWMLHPQGQSTAAEMAESLA